MAEILRPRKEALQKQCYIQLRYSFRITDIPTNAIGPQMTYFV